MDTTLINSFYYFFSAVPQVLAAILALFGVFVIFKIQNIKSELFGIGQSILDVFIQRGKFIQSNLPPLLLNEKMKNVSILDNIQTAIHRHNINELKSVMDLIENLDFQIYRGKYNSRHSLIQSLIKQTIYLSIITALLIIICLAAIPFGYFLMNHKVVLNSIFAFVIISISICFSGLIYILVKSLKENEYDPEKKRATQLNDPRRIKLLDNVKPVNS
jgi:hypothetical protein